MVSMSLAQFLLLLLLVLVILPWARTMSLPNQRKLESSPKNSRMPRPKESSSSSSPPQRLFLPTQDKGTDQYIAYHFEPGSTNADDDKQPVSPCIVFCGGFRSDMTGRKAVALEQHLQQKGRPYVRFDYRGHGQSSGTDCFERWTLTDWIHDTVAIVNHLCSVQPQPPHVILVGSSMGAWIALHVAQLLPELVVGVVTIAAAPDFTKDILEEVRQEEASWKELQSTGVYHRPSCIHPRTNPIPFPNDSWKMPSNGTCWNPPIATTMTTTTTTVASPSIVQSIYFTENKMSMSRFKSHWTWRNTCRRPRPTTTRTRILHVTWPSPCSPTGAIASPHRKISCIFWPRSTPCASSSLCNNMVQPIDRSVQ